MHKAMIKFEELLAEGIVTDIKKLYSSEISEDDLQLILLADPSKTHGYFNAMCSYFVNDNANLEVIKSYVDKFDKNKRKFAEKDINKFLSFVDLKTYVDEHSVDKSKREMIKGDKTLGAKTVFESNDCAVILITTVEAMIQYGKGTKWCTTGKEASYWFSYYTDDPQNAKLLTFYIVVDKTRNVGDPFYKSLVGVGPDNEKLVYDATDEKISFNEWLPMVPLDRYTKVFEYISYSLDRLMVAIGRAIKSYKINSDGSVDVDGSISMINRYDMKKMPIKFGKVTGDFLCANGKLETLEGAPNWVGGEFDCDRNKLLSLKGGPKYVGGDFNCSQNNLRSLMGAPDYIGGNFNCMANNYYPLSHKGLPKTIIGNTEF